MAKVLEIPSVVEISSAEIVAKLEDLAAGDIVPPKPEAWAFIDKEFELDSGTLSSEHARILAAPWPPAETAQEPPSRGPTTRRSKRTAKEKPRKQETPRISPSGLNLLMSENDLVLAIIGTRAYFQTRVEAKVKNQVNTSPSARPTFQEMLWALLVMSPPPAPVPSKGQKAPALVPYIKPVAIVHYVPIISEATELRATQLIMFVSQTGSLLNAFRLSPNILTKLGHVVGEINKSKFARYIGSRGIWPLRQRSTGAFVLLEWWAATHPGVLSDYQTAISPKAKDEGLRTELRRELSRTMGIKQGNIASVQDELLSVGFDFVAKKRRQMTIIVKEAYESLVAEARATPEMFFNDGPVMAEATKVFFQTRPRQSRFDEMVGRSEVGMAGNQQTAANVVKRRKSFSFKESD
ncbi:hypothetical protein M408DRAFT_29386 [Serendipita vermifera MAFF 305830]|uniref:Uncharacterized protein n=1 Tax=Serendipita vermifera MAFF 305830 TaxID=933852 RepID=A0A0C3ANP1_SERVB|nr:hypothetical protein M408DRAFT_29386 [Serendipita vermifera MAFF 305830]